MQDAMWELHEMMKPLASYQVSVRTAAGEVTGPMTMAIRESDGDHIFVVAGVAFVAGDVARIDPDLQLVVLR